MLKAQSVPTVVVRAPAKINLHLGVGPLRDDGFHELVTVFQAVSLVDTLSMSAAEETSITAVAADNSTVALNDIPLDKTNLVWRAMSLLSKTYYPTLLAESNVAAKIAKSIPVAGGMAGGSADAAAALVGLNALWELGLTRSELISLATQLGSDVPFSLTGGTALGRGRGEELTPILTRGTYHWVVATANFGLSTPTVFAELDRLRASGNTVSENFGRNDWLAMPTELEQALAAGDAHRVAPLLHNDLQAAAFSLQPLLRRTIRAGIEAGALGGIISGSGPSCVFLCADDEAAIAVAAELAGAGVASGIKVVTSPVSGAQVI